MPGRARSRKGKSTNAIDGVAEALRAAIDDLDELFLLCDADDRIVMFNRRWDSAAPGETTVGQTFEDFLRKGVASGRVPRGAGREEAWIQERLAARRAGNIVLERNVGDRWYQLKDHRLAGGGIATVGLEITDRKRVEQALAESEARFRSFAETGSDWIWETDAEDRYTWFGGAIERSVGRPATHYIGRTRSEIAAAAGMDLNADPWKSHMEQIARREPFRDVRQRRATPNGEIWLSISGAPRFDAAGRFLGYRAAVTNITALVESERRAQESSRLLTAAIENLNESIAVVDAEDRIVVANRCFRELNDGTRLVEPGHLYEEHLRAGIPLGNYPEAVGREEAWLAERLERHRRGGTIEVQRQDGKWLLVTDQRLPDGGMISFALDITERKHAEEALRNINADLDRRVAERTVALETAYRELESFSYSVSHDLRSPLGVIASFAGILASQESGRISEDGMRLVSVIDENAQRMGRLIDALLELMRMSRQALVHRRLDMARIASATCRDLQRAYPKASVQLGPLPEAKGDEVLVQQVYANLVGNALKFSSRQPSPRVEIGAEAGPGMPVYYVRDNGAGFDSVHAAKLFKPFERLHSEQEFPGTGIGLALANLIVQRHGGRIWAESAPGRGSTFRFTLAGGAPE